MISGGILHPLHSLEPVASDQNLRGEYHEGMATESQQTPGREETPEERADRNWTELTQELRVTQTGVQILTAFLLILPFQPRFAELTEGQRLLYLVLVTCGFVTTTLMVAPVSMHRFLFQRGHKMEIVLAANRITMIALMSLGLLIAGTVAFVFSVVVGGISIWIAPGAAVALLLTVWVWLPWRMRRRARTPHSAS